MPKHDPLIIALDTDSEIHARAIVESIGDAGNFYKIGLQLFTICGPSIVSNLISMGKRVFLDLKLHEIPNSVAGAVDSAGKLGVEMVTVHASAGSTAMRAAVKAAKNYPNLLVVAVTVVTSLAENDLVEIGITSNIQDQVVRLARLAEDSGCHGVVASPLEVSVLRQQLSANTLIITPGIRLADSADKDDQTRTSTPAGAIRAGANYLVIGRPITTAQVPMLVVQQIKNEIAVIH